MDMIDTLIPIAIDLTAAMNTHDRYQRLIDALKRAIPYDAAALLRIDFPAYFCYLMGCLTASPMRVFWPNDRSE